MILTIYCANTALCRVAEKAGFELFEKRTPINHKPMSKKYLGIC